MDGRPIGFFDSGLGGLTCVPYLLRAFPNERIVYFGDTARTPYGSKATTTIRTFASEITDFLIEEHDVKVVVIACNTVSAIALEALRVRHPKTPILSIISPASHAVAKICNEGNRIGVIGTKATIASETYPRKLLRYKPGLDIQQQACPALVPLIEEGIIESDIMDMTIRHYLDDFINGNNNDNNDNNIDTLVLGCTHYPLIRANIERLYPGLKIVDPSEEILKSISDTLDRDNIHAPAGDAAAAEHVFYASDLAENFVNMVNLIFSGTDYPVTFKAYPERKGGVS